MSLKDKTIVVTGGSRGLGLGLVEALVSRGARVTVVARDQAALAAVKQRLGVAVIPADVTDKEAAQRILAEVRPDIVVLNAGATPRMGRLDQVSWADFTATGANAYARSMGVEREAYLARFGAPLPPRQFGDHLVAVLEDPRYGSGTAFGLKGDTGITVLEGEAA